MLRTLSLTVCLLCAGLPAQVVTFTGDVAADFPPSSLFIVDPGGLDVGMPRALPAAWISGWDMDQCALAYDFPSDTLFVGFDTQSIAGDADGDGDPNRTSPQLVPLSGVDFPNWADSESGVVVFDLDNDGIFDVIFGIPGTGDASAIRGAYFNGTLASAPFSFGAPLPVQPILDRVPDNAARDLQFRIPGFSTVLTQFVQRGQTNIRAVFFMGSFGDDGIGEDFVPSLQGVQIPLILFCTNAPSTVQSLPNTCPVIGGEPVLWADNPAQGTTANLGLTSGQPNAPLWIWVSELPVGPWVDPRSGCTVYLDFLNPMNFIILAETTLDATGSYQDSYAIPIEPYRVGYQLLIQARTWATGGPIAPVGDWLSNALLITVGCP